MQYVHQTTPMLRREVFHEVRDIREGRRTDEDEDGWIDAFSIDS